MSLDVYLRGGLIGTLFPAGDDDYRFAYRPTVLDEHEAGTGLLSASLPLQREPFSREASRCLVEGLLPEGMWRRRIAKALEVDPSDGYALLERLGRDCAGAAVFVPEGADPKAPADVPGVGDGEAGDRGSPWLSAEGLEELVAPTPGACAVPASFCLGGVHRKLALVHEAPGGAWGLPGPGRPSTHVVKPETAEFPDMIVNEAFCMAVARRIGMRVAHCGIERIGELNCLIVKRFDREGEGLNVDYVHQENFCQALGWCCSAGWGLGDEAEDGPGFAECCGLLKALGRPGDVPAIIAASLFNYLIGNGDAHPSNYALRYGKSGPRFAPLVDLSSTAVYDSPIHSGLVLNEEYDATAYLLELAQVAEECEFAFDVFRQVAAATAANVDSALAPVADRARDQGWHAPVIDDIVDLARERAFGLVAEVQY